VRWRLTAAGGVLLVGDGIENPENARRMIDAAAMFGAACRFRDTKGLAAQMAPAPQVAPMPQVAPLQQVAPAPRLAPEGTPPDREAARGQEEPFLPITGAEVRARHARAIAFDNLAGARDLFGFHAGRDFALMVGNERRGLSRELAALASDRVQVPMLSRRINCLNVAAAAAVGLYYLCAPPVGAMAVRRDPRGRRPELLLFQPADHFEAGSTIRSAAAFGWERAFLEDPHRAWFGCDRRVRAEGRAAARRGRNDILLVPCAEGASHGYARVTVITCRRGGLPLHRVQLARGPSQLVVIPDESRREAAACDWSRFGAHVELASLQLPVDGLAGHYRYRLTAAIALAEVSRQVGRRQALETRAAPRRPIYDEKLARLAAAAGELVRFADLAGY
jgi:tRNA(Leu) C34 or U34 (ribose-2'-O)-methylase TrmL